VKILWASPLPPARTGVSDYAVELLPELARSAAVRVVAPPGWETPEEWPLGAECVFVSVDTVPDTDEIQLLHLGNNPHHQWLIERIGQPRTVVVLHDLVLHHLLVEATLALGREDRFAELLLEGHPEAAALVAGRSVGVTGRRDPFLFPARKALLSRTRAFVVHSRWAERLVAAEFPEASVARVGLAVCDPGTVDRNEVRGRLGLGPDEVVVMHLGFLTPEKGMIEILEAVGAARRVGISARLVVVGEGAVLGPLSAAASSIDVHDAVTTTGWIPADEFVTVPAAADLGVVLRTPSAGETSAAVLRFLACGTPVAVSGLRQFLEWPASAAPRVTPGPSGVADLTRRVIECTDPDVQRERRRTARSAYESGHRPDAVAAEILGSLARSGDLLRDVG
jgi:glycosyltransferase involved in cell wall biosynthesis